MKAKAGKPPKAKTGKPLKAKTDKPLKASEAKAIVQATAHYNDPEILAKVSENLGNPMLGVRAGSLAETELLANRGW